MARALFRVRMKCAAAYRDDVDPVPSGRASEDFPQYIATGRRRQPDTTRHLARIAAVLKVPASELAPGVPGKLPTPAQDLRQRAERAALDERLNKLYPIRADRSDEAYSEISPLAAHLSDLPSRHLRQPRHRARLARRPVAVDSHDRARCTTHGNEPWNGSDGRPDDELLMAEREARRSNDSTRPCSVSLVWVI